MIAGDAVTGAKIADDQINSEHYVDGSIDTQHIADAQVTTAKIADSNVTTAKIAADAVTAAKLADSAVVTANIVDAQITTAKINDTAVTNAKLAAGAVTTAKITDAQITTAKINDTAVTTAKLDTGAVTTAKITDAQITTAKINDEAVTLAKLEHGTSSNDGKFLRANNGADPTFETVTSTNIIGNADNRVITGSGTANTLNGESNVTIDSSARMTISSTAHGDALTISSGGSTYGGSLHLTGTGSPNQDYVIAVGGGDNAYVSGRGLLIRDITNSANRIGILTNGNLQIHDGDLKVASGHGIDFGATSNAGTGTPAEILDDYEIGTWAPLWSNATSGGTTTANNMYGLSLIHISEPTRPY